MVRPEAPAPLVDRKHRLAGGGRPSVQEHEGQSLAGRPAGHGVRNLRPRDPLRPLSVPALCPVVRPEEVLSQRLLAPLPALRPGNGRAEGPLTIVRRAVLGRRRSGCGASVACRNGAARPRRSSFVHHDAAASALWSPEPPRRGDRPCRVYRRNRLRYAAARPLAERRPQSSTRNGSNPAGRGARGGRRRR